MIRSRSVVGAALAAASVCALTGQGAIPAHAAPAVPAAWAAWQASAPTGMDSSDHAQWTLTSPVITSDMVGKTLVMDMTGVTNVATVDAASMHLHYQTGAGWFQMPAQSGPIVTGATTGRKATITSAMVGHQVWAYGELKSAHPASVTVNLIGQVIIGAHTWTAGTVLRGTTVGSDMGIAVPSTDLMWLSDSARNKTLSQVAATGAKYVRVDVDMSQLTWTDPATGRPFYDWATLDKTVAAAKAHGLIMVGILQTLSDYALPATQHGLNRTGPTTPGELAAFNTYVHNVVAHVGSSVNYWEVWNEPNLAQFWGGGAANNPGAATPSAAAYATLLRTVYPTIKQANPGAVVVTGGTGGAGGDRHDVDAASYVQQMYAAGARGSFDALAIHAYTDASNNTIGEFARLSQYRQVMDAHGDTSKPLWITEAGTKVGHGLATEAQQAAMEPQMIHAWQSVHDRGPLMIFSLNDDVDPGFGLLRQDGSARPALAEVTRDMAKPST